MSQRATLELTNTEAVKEAVAAGLGVAFLSERAIRHELVTHRLIAVRVSGQRLTRTICLLTLNGQKLSPAAAILRNLMLADFITHICNQVYKCSARKQADGFRRIGFFVLSREVCSRKDAGTSCADRL